MAAVDPMDIISDVTMLDPVMQGALKMLGEKHAFRVTESIRTLERQRVLFASKKSKTLSSRHFTGLAADLFPYAVGGYANKEAIKAMQDDWKIIAKNLGYPNCKFLDWDSCHFSLNDGVHI